MSPIQISDKKNTLPNITHGGDMNLPKPINKKRNTNLI